MMRWLMAAAVLAAIPAAAAGSADFKQRLAEYEKQIGAAPTNTELLFRAADFCHDEGVKENKEAVKLAEKFLGELLKIDPSNAPALALLGSTYTMKGRDAFWPGTQISLVKEGNRFMDRAAALAPENFQVRIMRGLNNVHMPGFLKREDISREDLQWVWQRVRADPAAHREATQQEVALWLGVALKKARRPSEARSVWEQGLAVNPKSRFGIEIQKHLAKDR